MCWWENWGRSLGPRRSQGSEGPASPPPPPTPHPHCTLEPSLSLPVWRVFLSFPGPTPRSVIPTLPPPVAPALLALARRAQGAWSSAVCVGQAAPAWWCVSCWETEQLEPYLGPPSGAEHTFLRWTGAAVTLWPLPHGLRQGEAGAARSPAPRPAPPVSSPIFLALVVTKKHVPSARRVPDTHSTLTTTSGERRVWPQSTDGEVGGQRR